MGLVKASKVYGLSVGYQPQSADRLRPVLSVFLLQHVFLGVSQDAVGCRVHLLLAWSDTTAPLFKYESSLGPHNSSIQLKT